MPKQRIIQHKQMKAIESTKILLTKVSLHAVAIFEVYFFILSEQQNENRMHSFREKHSTLSSNMRRAVIALKCHSHSTEDAGISGVTSY